MLNTTDYWPIEKPNVPTDEQGWLAPCVAQRLQETVSSDMKIAIELGAWLGKSTRYLCDLNPNMQVITIDTWQGSPEHVNDPRLPFLKDIFLANCWNYRKQIIPIQADSCVGMQMVYSMGIIADLVYIDADHSYEGVKRDISTALKLFPKAKIIGDDWAWGAPAYPVRNAAVDVALEFGKTVVGFSNVWWYQ